MSSKALGVLIRVSVIAIALCGIFFCAYAIPAGGKTLIESSPYHSDWYYPWLIFSWLLAIPCFAILFLVWKTSKAVIDETVFTLRTARWVKAAAMLMFGDAVFLFVGNVVLLLFDMNHPSVLLVSILIDIFAVTLALMAAVLARYLTKAAALQEESEGTI